MTEEHPENPPNPADFGLDPDDCQRHAGKPAEFLKLYHQLREDLVPVGANELRVVDDIVHYYIQIDQARLRANHEVSVKLARIEEDTKVLAESPKLALSREERLVAERLADCLQRRRAFERAGDRAAWEENEIVFAQAFDDLKSLRWTFSPAVARELRLTESHCNRQIKELRAELRRLRNDRISFYVKEDKRERERQLDRLRQAEEAKNVTIPTPETSQSAELLAATTAAFAATMLQAKQAEANANPEEQPEYCGVETEQEMLADIQHSVRDPRAEFIVDRAADPAQQGQTATRSP